MTMSVEEYMRAAERARILARVVEMDPTDIHSRVALGNLRRQGLDVTDPEWVLGFDPESLVDAAGPGPEEVSAPAGGAAGDEWVESMMEEALGFISVGLHERAIPLLEVVLRMQPGNDVVRSWLFALNADRGVTRTDPNATLRIELPR
ncbi:MAG: hypothetical protein DRJ42_03280 [Deltaproteobacteria bacterium]|nr:MAG: hypothetical protein DRJ42_03280 [Deltaproteobacteria bacterium]